MISGAPEGATPLDRDELEGLRFRHVTTRAELDELEQANITEGLLWLARRRSKEVLTDTFMRELHRRLFGEVWSWAGEYRRSEKNIGAEPHQIVVQLRQLLGNAQYWAEHQVYTPLEAASRFHHRLVQIHPFPNGNGRHGRIAADAFLETLFGHPPIQWASGVVLQEDSARRTQYIAALRRADEGSYADLLAFVRR